ncbi:MAG: ANTAR domain-containing protein [Lachnospiraceae bacterium]|nr:ANTAR domain-containing protein [Lachnospiraceae bacterium]
MANIVVAFPKVEDAISIKNLLVRNGYPVTAVCTSGTKVLSTIDDYNDGIIVCGYKLNDMLFSELRESVPAEFEILLLASAMKISSSDCTGVITVTMPLKAGDLLNTIEMLSMNIARRKKKRKNVPKKRTEEEQKTIDQAKKILIERNHMTESEVHRYMQKTSMDSGTNLVETAQMIIRIMLN